MKASQEDPLKMMFQTDLPRAAQYHVAFLEDVSKHTALDNRDVLQRALYRYEHLWLPLAAESPNEALSAPLDVEWVWHCHLLAPVAYQRDCVNIVGKVVDHRVNSQDDRAWQLNRSRTLWLAKYPHHPFELPDLSSTPLCMQPPTLNTALVTTCERGFDSESAPAVASTSMSKIPKSNDLMTACFNTHSSQLTYDILAAVERQSKFFYQVSLPHYKDDRFLMAAEKRYRKFLLLKQKNPALFIVPCYDVDLIWHTHQLHPLAYNKDTEAILGTMLNHDDTDSDRSEGSKLSRSDGETRALWRKAFGENFAVSGAMYRGEPPAGKLQAMPENEAYALMNSQCLVQLESVELKNVPTLKGKLKLEVFASVSKGDAFFTRLAKLYGGPVWRSGSREESSVGLGKDFRFDTNELKCMKTHALTRPSVESGSRSPFTPT